LTNLVNPNTAVIYLSLLPQFINPANGSILGQALVLGTVQIVISVSINAMIAITAATIAVFLTQRPAFALVQRWVMDTVLAGLAVRMATEAPR
jgi:threonine/homoserine/homoserine lactone efflux protein